MRGATPVVRVDKDRIYISIHAPHAGRDGDEALIVASLHNISIHAPHAGRDVRLSMYCTLVS